MKHIPKVLAGIAVVAVLGVGIYTTVNRNNKLPGIDVSGTNCDQIATARAAVNDEFNGRQQAAQTQLDTEMERISDNFWTENRRLEDAHHACVSAAAVADPCKPAFEKVSSLYEEIMAQFNAGNGFNEAKYQEREQAKKDYDECVQKAKNDEFYKADIAQCDANLAAGQAANQQQRQSAESAAQATFSTTVESATSARDQKQAMLDAIERKCNQPVDETNLSIGSMTTGDTGTQIRSTSPACTGVFAGNDPELGKKLSDLQNKLNKAKAAGLREGIYGTDHLQAAVDAARQELKESERTCETDADCGDPTPICCSGTQVGRVFCDAGVCAAEQTDCDDGEICTGQPAQCVAPATGITSEPLSISGQVVIGQSCNNRLRVIHLQQKSDASDRFEIVGNIPSWLSFSAIGGKLPQDVTALIDCAALQAMGPGVYKGEGNITVYNTDNALINTIPLTVTITVISAADADSNIGSISSESQPTEPISASPTQVSFIYDHAQPVCPLPISGIALTGPAGSTWTLVSKLPVWLSAPDGISGNAPGTVNLRFSCQLEEYKDQEQQTTLQFKVKTPDGTEQTVSVQVNGSFINFAK